MRAAILEKPGVIQLAELPEPDPAAGELKISVHRVGICGSDLARYEGRMPQKNAVVFGHEFSGRVSAIGTGVHGFTEGQPVTVAPLINCGQCAYCKQDKGYLCAKRLRFGTDVPGALQEFVCVPADRAYPLPEEMPLEHGAVAEPLAVALHAVHQAGDIHNADIATLGGGAIGLLIAAAARALGAGRILVVDLLPERVALANQMGFQGILVQSNDVVEKLRQHTGGEGVQFLFEATGSPRAAENFLPMLANLGTFVVVGRIEKPVAINLDAMLMKEARLVTSRYFSLADFSQAVKMITTGAVDVQPLIQKTLDFSVLGQEQGQVVMNAARQSVRLMVNLAKN